MGGDAIIISGAREHNLKNITVSIPRHRLTVITGLSGSGKSSLAFDTLFAEGQRRYVESLSAYARQFLAQMPKPDVDFIEGLSPAIALEQRSGGANPRSIVATATEVHDYLRLLFANAGEPHCPRCGAVVRRQTADGIVESLLGLPAGTRLVLLAPLARDLAGVRGDPLEAARRQGFVRVRIDGRIGELDVLKKADAKGAKTLEVVIDRLVVGPAVRARLTDSVELALRQGEGVMGALQGPEGDAPMQELAFSEAYSCQACGVRFGELSARSFSFNSPEGACPTCSGLGTELVLDEDLVVSKPELSLKDGAIQAWRKGGRRLILLYRKMLKTFAEHAGISMETPYRELDVKHRRALMWGSGDDVMTFSYRVAGSVKHNTKPFEGVIPNLMRRYSETRSDGVRQQIRTYMSRRRCDACGGLRLKPEARACTLAGRSIVDVTGMSIRAALDYITALQLTDRQRHIAGDMVREVERRLRCLLDMGLDYLTLDRETATLSGGELQRMRLATQIGAGLVGVLYVLDEPTIGLHPRDTIKLIGMLQRLKEQGNTVVVVEHDELMIREADQIIDLGPGAGREGGEVLCAGPLAALLATKPSLTARYLNGEGLSVPQQRKGPSGAWLCIEGAAENNLKTIDVRFPIGLLTCVTGVSGSGKSTLVDDILRRALFRHFYGSKERPGVHGRLTGLESIDSVILIDQSPVGRTPRSNPATYTGAFGDIRDLFAALPASKVRGYGPGRFSFNVKGGRCEACRGDGYLRLEMHFLPDVYVTCESCGGRRYNRETLNVFYKGRSIADVLAMTVAEGLDFFAPVPTIARKLRALAEVGLGYLEIGQSATTLSGGEAQRMKLSAELGKRATGKTLYLMDEPTTGLHFADVHRLLDIFMRLRDAGNTVVVIEHNLDVIKSADHVIDLGPEGGDGGGWLVAQGTPEVVAAADASHTGRLLRDALARG